VRSRGQRTQAFDRERIYTFGRAQCIVEEGIFLVGSELLLFRRLVSL